ncbi:alkaline phosphatase [Erythrobacter sp. LQ02-29]|uniref:alkaline phosphatase n=1 Tax=Erythrobacter sp. LQ02-29 TaxID=2920384 RepID=UPI001F4EAE81|nr:alkaline phosphatase [Erythrobacter sp. LQ02-29]MCP9222000.1 alkaline phosphatase [Erythrobacter sp. LQ02-29]
MPSLRFPALALGALALTLGACTTDTGGDARVASASQAAPMAPTGQAKNVILFIGDGMGISVITATRILAGQRQGQTGEEYALPFEKFPHVALVKTYNTDAQVPDSAGTATAMNSGEKTRMGMLGVGPGAARGDCAASLDNRLPHIADLARKSERAVGIVTTTRLTHATPAAVFAHAPERDWEADGDMPASALAEGCTDIASQLVAYPFDVALGGGVEKFVGKTAGGDRADGTDLAKDWAARTGGSYVTSETQLEAAPQGKPVLGLFSPSHMTYMLDRKSDSAEPTLTQMTAQAVDRLGRDPHGYFLMVEGGRIDHGLHAGQAGYALEEGLELAKAVQYAIDHTDPANTLILVTADHSHVLSIAGYPKRGNPILGLVRPPEGGDEEHHGGTGDQPALAGDGKPYTTLGFANGPGAVQGTRPVPETGPRARQQSLVPLGSETHGGEDVALFASGPGSDEAHGVIEQNVIFDIMADAMGVSEKN